MTSIPSFERDPYLRRLDVEVLGVGEAEGRPYAVLDDTLLYPEGGGQPADHGRLGDIAVVDVQKVEGEIRHYLASPGETGTAVLLLDWRRRYDHMQQHTAQHLFSALALARFGWATRSFHLGPETSDIELDAPDLSATQLAALEDAAMAEIVTGRPISTRRVSPEAYAELDVRSRGLPDGHRGDIRLVEIEGIDLNTCGGTHLKSTGEIEAVKILGTERLRGGNRVRWVAGGRVRSRLAAHEARTAELRGLFDSDDASLVEIANLKLDQFGRARRRIRQLESELAQAKSESSAASAEPAVTMHFDDADGGFLQQTGRALLALAPAKACLLTASGEKGSFFLVGVGSESSLDAGELGPRIAEILDGRGGGSGAIFQGKAGSLNGLEEAESLLLSAITTSKH
ncbi:MAG: alanyl-tRNA editing protein [bacterium]|nr:alanyl-tRNA editing protein [bacterium]